MASPVLNPSDVANRIRLELETAARRGHPSGQLAKVTSLLHAFRDGDSATSIQTVERALGNAGVVLKPPRESGSTFERTGVVQLTLESPVASAPTVPRVKREIRMSEWSVDELPSVEAPLGEWSPEEGTRRNGVLRWFDIEPAPAPTGEGRLADWEAGAAGDALELEATRLHGVLAKDWCPGLTLEIVREFVRPDPLAMPGLNTFGNEEGPRSLSVVAAVATNRARDRGEPGADPASTTGDVILQKVQMLVGTDWIISCWPASRTATGAAKPRFGAPLLRQPFLSRVHHLRTTSYADLSPTGSDLGLLLAQTLVDTHGATHRMMQAWLADWEVGFYSRLGEQGPEDLQQTSRDLDALLAPVAEARRRVTGLLYARTETRDRSWLAPTPPGPGQTTNPKGPHPLTEPLHDALKDHDTALNGQIEAIRADMDVVVLRSSAAQQESSNALQKNLGLLTGLVLFPTLIAGIFGANTTLPGGETWRGFTYMLASMTVSVFVALFFWRWRHLRNLVTKSRGNRTLRK